MTPGRRIAFLAPAREAPALLVVHEPSQITALAGRAESLPKATTGGVVVSRKSKVGIVERLAMKWCQLFHKQISRPVNGEYKCWKCLREFEVRWR